MRKPVFATVMLVAAASAIGRPAATAGELIFKTSLLERHLAWPAEVSAIPPLLAIIRSAAIKNRRQLLAAAATDKAERGKRDYPSTPTRVRSRWRASARPRVCSA
ncbi:MAG: hypothetical protein H0W71_00570 [Sphingomonas sp.]|nr:hypothetical protein [Sphingomonas sp.]